MVRVLQDLRGRVALGPHHIENPSAVNAFFVFSAVAFPAYAAARGDLVRLRRGYLTSVRLQSAFGTVAGAGLAVVAPDLVRVVFGERWMAAAPALRALALYAAFRALGAGAADVFRAVGRPRAAAWLAGLRLLLVVPALVVGASRGITGVAIAQVGVAVAMVGVSQGVAARTLGLRVRDVGRAMLPAAAAGGATAVAAGVASGLAGSSPAHLVAATVAGGLAAGVTLVLVDRTLVRELGMLLRRCPATPPSELELRPILGGAVPVLDGTPSLRAGLHALETAGLRWCVRNAPEHVEQLPPGLDLDVLLESKDLRRAEPVLRRAGFRRIRAPGHPGHRFFVACARGEWLKLDLVVRAPGRGGRRWVHDAIARRERHGDLWTGPAPAYEDYDARRSRARGRLVTALRRRRPAGIRRAGAVVAFLGPDGAGKGTVLDELERLVPIAVTRVRLGRGQQRAGLAQTPKGPPVWREVAFVARKWVRAAALLGRAYARAWRGHVVLCDRHPRELLATRPERGRLARTIEDRLTRVLPEPDAIVLLDAPSDVLVARKPEHPVEVVERWRASYRAAFPRATVVPTDVDVGTSVRLASQVVWSAVEDRLST